jgi:hypothetical protein
LQKHQALRWIAASPVIAVQLIELLIFKLRVRLGVITNASKQGFNSISIHTTEFFGIF